MPLITVAWALYVTVVAVFLTSILSGVAGMAGGIILMAVLVSLFSVPTAMIAHGIVQAAANGSRFWFLREHIVWSILPGYFLGVLLTFGIFYALGLVVDAALILLVVGLFPWLARVIPKSWGLDITDTRVSFVCGSVITAVQLVAGASGPLLDVFYQRTDLNRFQVVASKAITQAISHLVKIGYFSFIIVTTAIVIDPLITWWFVGLLLVVSIAGTRIGTWLLHHVNEASFQKYTEWLILGLGTVIAAKGAVDLVTRLLS